MATLNAFLALISALGGILVAIAYLPHVSLFGLSPASNIVRAATLAGLAYYPRALYWDVYWFAMGYKVSNPLLNCAVSALIILSVYFALRARYLAIPDEERGEYNIITAIRYPNKMRFWIASRGSDD